MSSDPDDRDPPSQPYRAMIGLVILVGAVVLALFIVHRLQESARMQDCIASGRTNCAPIEVPAGR